MSSSLWLHGLQHARLLCTLISPRVFSNSCSLNWWCYLTIKFSFSISFLHLPSIFPSSRVFSNELPLCIKWPKYWSFNFSISPSNEYSGLIVFRIDWCELLQCKGLSRIFSSTAVKKHQFFNVQPSLWSNSHIHTWLLEKP